MKAGTNSSFLFARTPMVYVAALRVLMGLVFLLTFLDNAGKGLYGPAFRDFVAGWSMGNPIGWYRAFLETFVLPHWQVVAAKPDSSVGYPLSKVQGRGMRSVHKPLVLVLLAVLSEGAYYGLATRYGLWSAMPGDLRFLWVYGAAVALYLAACFTIWVSPSRGRVMLVVILAFAVLFRLTLLAEPPEPNGDIYRYVWDGRVLTSGINPYLFPPSAPQLATLAIPSLGQVNNPDVVTPYPPLSEGVFALLYWLWLDSLLAMRATFVAFDLATIALLLALLRHFQRSSTWSIVCAWSPLPIVEFAGHGHLDALLLPLLMASLLLATRGWRAWSGVALALATLVKVVPMLLVPVLFRRWGWRGLVPYSVVVALGALPFLGAGQGFMGGAFAMFERWEANASMYRWAIKLNEGWRIVGDAGHSFRMAAAALVLVFSLSLALRKPVGDHRLAAGCFWVFAVSLLVSTTVFPWYVTWTLPLLTLLLAAGADDRYWPAYVGWLLFTCATGIWYLQYLTGSWAQSWPAAIVIVEYFPAYVGIVWAATILFSSRRAPCQVCSTAAHSVNGSPALRAGVVIPTLNEEAAISQVIASIPRELAHDVVVVDGGSSDRTVALAEAAGARVIHEARRGYGRACATGSAALGQVDIVVFLDGDLSDYPQEMPRLIKPIVAGYADLVVGSRLRGRREPGALPPHSVFGNWLAALLMQVLYGLASGVTLGAARPESTEVIEVMRFGADQAIAMARRGELQDAQSALALLAAEPLIWAQLRG